MGAPTFIVAPCVTCGKQPTIAPSDYVRGLIEVTCIDCTDADYDGERFVQTNPVVSSYRLGEAIDEWNQIMWEEA